MYPRKCVSRAPRCHALVTLLSCLAGLGLRMDQFYKLTNYSFFVRTFCSLGLPFRESNNFLAVEYIKLYSFQNLSKKKYKNKMSRAWKQQQQYLFWRKCDGQFRKKSETTRQKIDCEQSLFFVRFCKGSGHARERRSRETRETRAAAREEKKKNRLTVEDHSPWLCGWSVFFRGHLRVSRFARRTTEKKRDCF